MREPATAPWGLSISEANFKKLKAGGTGKEIYMLVVKPSDGDSNTGVKIEAITWEQNKGGIRISEEQAKKEVVIITRRLLECDFDAPPEYDVSDLWNHPAAQIK
ncbi:hypothetical protein ABOM_005930 [Aspergillus bombycis]|uniref:Uncharacterized protein n=1 Tax=Aspergillus bombycis TaxID=109264 RepID=A0A1F7ZWX9_9EURO|nr:hypothetical protein ABOM_005930 [Aspergillus bombycis]OGM43937.1 hypothetical protein ABOM_005930 [Aspergillus bombycis]